jgi:hypothetical protein
MNPTNFNNKHLKYKRVLDKPQTKESETEPDYILKKSTKELLNKNINPDEFREILRNNGINPNVEGINKMIRQHESGSTVKYNELLYALIKNRDSTFDPTQIKINVKKRVLNMEAAEKENMSGFVITKNGSAQMNYMPKKKLVDINQNYQSNKDLFDWELSTLKKIKSGEFEPPTRHKNEYTHKTVFESHVFDKIPENNNNNDETI